MRAKKSLGQHFLKSKQMAISIAEAANLSANDIVLEIGPGKGILTKELIHLSGKVVAVEKDRILSKKLEEVFAEEVASEKLSLVEADILDTDLEKLGLLDGKYKVVANIPYYITGSLLRFLLSKAPRPKTIVLLVQKEVAERIVAKKQRPLDSARGKESLLSISVKVFGMPRYIKTVKSSHFSPQPKVDSAILLIENISDKKLKNAAGERFFKVLRAGFSKKRKVLRTNLTAVAEKKQIEEVFKQLSIHSNARAEEISVEKWVSLAENIS